MSESNDSDHKVQCFAFLEQGRAQKEWALTSIRQRLRVIHQLRYLIVAHAELLAEAVAGVNAQPVVEKLVSEVLPLVDACRWLERRAASVLKPRKCGRAARPFWLQGFRFEVQRQPYGIILIIGPGNYPLFLPAVQTLHALVAGNAVLLKPAPGTRSVALAFAKLVDLAGLKPGLLTILEESIPVAQKAMSSGVDKVVFTGKSESGRDVLSHLSINNIPAVMELSGQDAVVILADANVDLVVRALRFGIRLNGGDTCMVPQRLIVAEAIANDLLDRLQKADVPELPLVRFSDMRSVLQCIEDSNFGLGVSIFTENVELARSFAARIRSGFVLINDLIVPTADPRMPFGGVKASGFGVTRGDEGLLEMTFPHVVAVRQCKSYPHYEAIDTNDIALFSSYMRMAYGPWRKRLPVLPLFFRSIIKKYNDKRLNV